MEFKLEGKQFVELCDLLKITGVAQTGGHAKMIIQGGEVLVDGETETRRRKKLSVGAIVEASGEKIEILP